MGRDWRVDTLRGYFLVAMTLGHFPNPLARFTEYTFGYASAPDGFVFLSGLVSAWVYLALRQKRGSSAMRSKVFRRAGTIYLTHIGLLVSALVFASRLASGVHRAEAHPWQRFVSGALLWNQAGFDAILPMYCIFLVLSPLVLKQFSEGRAWLIGLVSAALWISAQFGLGDSSPAVAEPITFNLFVWQAYFIAGQYIGFRGVRAHPLDQRSGITKSRLALAACIAISLALLIDRHLFLLSGMKPILGFHARPDHNPFRFLDAACLGYILWWIPRSVDVALMKLRFFQFLNFIGGHALQVFAFSMLITRFESNTTLPFSPAAKIIVTLLTVLSLGLPALAHKTYQQIRRGSNPDASAGIRTGYRSLFATPK